VASTLVDQDLTMMGNADDLPNHLVEACCLQTSFASGTGSLDCIELPLEEVDVDDEVGSLIVKHAVLDDICMNPPVVKVVNSFKEGEILGGGSNKSLSEPGRKGMKGIISSEDR